MCTWGLRSPFSSYHITRPNNLPVKHQHQFYALINSVVPETRRHHDPAIYSVGNNKHVYISNYNSNRLPHQSQTKQQEEANA